MPAIKITAGEIVSKWKGDGPCDIVCRLCGNRVVDDAAPTIWNGYVGLGQTRASTSTSSAMCWKKRYGLSLQRSSTASASRPRTTRVRAMFFGSSWIDTDGEARP
jgi:hypothetical protein